MKLYHNSQSDKYRRPFGAAVVGLKVKLSLKADKTTEKVFLRTWQNGIGEKLYPMNRTAADDEYIFETEITMPKEPCLLWYFFVATDTSGNTVCYGNKADRLGGEGIIWENGTTPESFQITVYKEDKSPSWFKDAIVYQIFPDRFFRGSDAEERMKNSSHEDKAGIKRFFHDKWDDTPFYTKNPKGEVTRWGFFGGTLKGIEEKITYLKSLGVNAIYLNPIFEASSNHRYDTGDYMKIDSMLGDEESFKELCEVARENGIRIILDGVFSHTGADSKYFNKYGNYEGKGAYDGPESHYYNWYTFKKDKDDYECWWGVTDLPNVDELNPSYMEHICGEDGVIRHWLKMGASGWRLDVADELPDEFIKEIRKAIRETKDDGLLMGEVWEDASNKISYGVHREYFFGDELQSTMHYPFRDNAIAFMLGKDNAKGYARKMMSIFENYPPENLKSALNLVGSHDRVRILTVLGEAPENLTEVEKECYKLDAHRRYIAVKRLKLISLLQYLSPGVPCIYYGDEAGLEGFADPFNRGTYPWGKEDQELMAHYRMLTLIKKQYPHLTEGSYKLEAPNDDVLIVRRELNDSELILVINRNSYEWRSVSIETKGNKALELIASKPVKVEDGKINLDMDALSAKLIISEVSHDEEKGLDKAAGVLCHLTSLPGTLPGNAYRFIDFLEESGQKLWQVLPLNPTGLADSPYMSPCAFAGNTDLLPEEEIMVEPAEFEAFCSANAFWLDDYALFLALSKKFDGAYWQEWPESVRKRENLEELRTEFADEIEATKKAQCAFFTMWNSIKEYANKKGIRIIGDAPLYVAPNSSDVWANQDLFFLDNYGNPAMTAGVPPDYYAVDGQNWGSPLYRWENMKKDGYDWWIKRLRTLGKSFDYVRLDHFRGFSAYYAIPQGKTGKEGLWMPGPGKEFFDILKNEKDMPRLVAEDMGLLDADVHNLRGIANLPGMMVWQFSYEDMLAMTQEEADNRIFYSGTHDNQTILGWAIDTFGEEKAKEKADEEMDKLYASKGAWVIVQIQDALGLDDDARMNTPGTMGKNWHWKASSNDDWEGASKSLKKWTEMSGR